MTPPALVRIRRSKIQEPTLRFLSFRLRDHWFCVPLAIARRVIPQPAASSDIADAGLIHLQNQAIPTLDTASLVYGTATPQLSSQRGLETIISTDVEPLTYVVVVELPQIGSLGLIVEGPVTLGRAYQSAFSPVPPVYLSVHQLRGISSVINPDARASDSHPYQIFVLAVEQLLP